MRIQTIMFSAVSGTMELLGIWDYAPTFVKLSTHYHTGIITMALVRQGWVLSAHAFMIAKRVSPRIFQMAGFIITAQQAPW